METKNIKEFIKRARDGVHPEEVVTLLDDFEEFIDLYNQKEKALTDPLFKEKVFLARDQFLTSFNKVAASYGLSTDTVISYFENPNNFSNEQWQNMQKLKQEIGGSKTSAKKIKPQKMRI